MRAPARSARAAALTVLVSLGATGCLSRLIPEAAPPALTYDFGPPPAEPPAPLPLPFQLDDVTAPSWLDTPSIYYRRLDERPSALRAYAQNRWIAAAPELFAARARQRLSQASPTALLEGPPVHIELVSFEQVFTGAEEAYVVGRARAFYTDFEGRTRRQEFEQRRTTTADVNGATEALPIVADALIDDVLDWLRSETLDVDR